MTEEDPFKDPEDLELTKLPLTGPHIATTFDKPPSADALEAQEAAIRKHLRDRQPPQGPPSE
jgi:hypothetical protein